MRRLLLSIIAMLAMLPAAAVFEVSNTAMQQVLHELDDSLSKRQLFIDRRQAEINHLVDSFNRHGIDEALLSAIAERYTGFNNDSALSYLALAIESPKCKNNLPFAMRRAMLLPLSGFFNPALETYDSIRVENIPEDLLPLYYESGRQMYSYMAAFSADNPSYKAIYNSCALEHQKRLLEILPKGSLDYKYNLGEFYSATGQKGKAKALLEEVFDKSAYNSKFRARSAYHLSLMANEDGNSNAHVFYLASSALADLSAATREVASLQKLGYYLYTLGDINRSYNYLTEALASAVECGASLRMIESSRSLPIIEQAKIAQIDANRHIIYIIVAILLVVVLVLAITMFRLNREMRHMRQLQNNLRQANHIKEVYISQFLNLCSIYMDKLNQFCKIANRKIITGKIDDLYHLTKSGKFVEEQTEEFHEVFDNAFLHIYPGFVKQVNSLLREDAKIELKEGERLNTDLRILALMRLGIEESARIAQILNYSLNTIYSYRNRTKARAIDRDNFETNILKIQADTYEQE